MASVIIERYEDIREANTLHTVYTFALPDELEGKLRWLVYRELIKHGNTDGYFLRDISEAFEWGASAWWEEVLLRISDGLFSGSAEAVISSLINKFTRRAKRSN